MHVAHQAMSNQQIQLELLVGNHSIGSNAHGTMLSAVGSLPDRMPKSAGITLGQV
jgi:hypothetical protein